MSDISERVKKIVVEHLGVDEAKVTEEASFVDDLGADSLDTVELVMAFEEEFGCEIPDDAADLPEALALRAAHAGGPVAYLCTGTQCSAPITDFAAFEAELAQQEPRFG